MTLVSACSRIALATGIALGVSAQAFAQDADPAPETAAAQSPAGGLEDIVITAQRRGQSLQNVPISVTALTAADVQRSGADNSLNLANLSPGLQMNTQRSTLTPYLRGVGTQNGGVGEEGSIATYVDNVYVAMLAGANFALNNIERIEVLRGPQGTLFGRNATGGLIHVITRDPQFTPSLDVNLGYANYDTLSGNVYATTGLSDNVAIDFAGYYSNQRDGWGRNLTLGNDVNVRREWAIRSKLLIQATDALTIRISGDYNDRENDTGSTRTVIPGATLIGGFGFQGTIYDTQSNLPLDVSFNQWGVSLQADYDFGNTTLTSITAYRDGFQFNLFDQDASVLNLITAPLTEVTETFQQELLLVGSTGRLEYTLGAFFFYSNAAFDLFQLRSSVIPAQNIDRFSEMTTYSYAGFAQGTYRFNDRTSFTAGLRFTRDERERFGEDFAAAGSPAGAGTFLRDTNGNAFPNEVSYNKLTWRFALDHRFSENVLGYGTISRGFKSGIFNLTNPYEPAVRPETLDAYEIGIKTDLFDRTFRFNLSGFYYDYKDIQLTRVDGGVTQLLNAATARIYGLDVEAIYSPRLSTGRLELRAALSYLNGEYLSFPGAPFTTRNPAGGNTQVPGDASGNDTIRTPPLTLSLGVDYRRPIGNHEIGFNVSYYYNDGFYWEPDNRYRESSYNLLNALVSFSGPDDRWRVSAFMRNITNERYYSVASFGTFGDQAAPGAPRTYGVSLGFRFGG